MLSQLSLTQTPVTFASAMVVQPHSTWTHSRWHDYGDCATISSRGLHLQRSDRMPL